MSDTTDLIQRLRADVLWYRRRGNETIAEDCRQAADALEQQAAQIAEKDTEIARLTECLSKANANHEHFERAWYLRGDEIEALRADAERMRELLADANETLHGNYTVLMRLILTNPPGGRYSFFSARDGSMIEATGPINQTMTVIAALDAALRQEQPT